MSIRAGSDPTLLIVSASAKQNVAKMLRISASAAAASSRVGRSGTSPPSCAGLSIHTFEEES